MPRAYSQDLRDRVIDVVESGAKSCRSAARRFGVSESSTEISPPGVAIHVPVQKQNTERVVLALSEVTDR